MHSAHTMPTNVCTTPTKSCAMPRNDLIKGIQCHIEVVAQMAFESGVLYTHIYIYICMYVCIYIYILHMVFMFEGEVWSLGFRFTVSTGVLGPL